MYSIAPDASIVVNHPHPPGGKFDCDNERRFDVYRVAAVLQERTEYLGNPLVMGMISWAQKLAIDLTCDLSTWLSKPMDVKDGVSRE